jgi:hypothetical protein
VLLRKVLICIQSFKGSVTRSHIVKNEELVVILSFDGPGVKFTASLFYASDLFDV